MKEHILATNPARQGGFALLYTAEVLQEREEESTKLALVQK